MGKCTVSKAEDNGKAFTASARANDIRPGHGVRNKLRLADI